MTGGSLHQPDRITTPAARLHRGGGAALRFTRSPDGRTFIAHQRVAYPFHVTRPFYIEDDPEGMLTLYLQSVSGGVFADDRLELDIVAQANSKAHVTTQASTIVHSMQGASASQVVRIDAQPGAFLEFLPDPLILFPRARLETRVQATVHEGATLLLCDAYTTHDPGAGNARFDRLRSVLQIERTDGSVVCLDRFDIDGSCDLGGLSPGPSTGHAIVCCVSTESSLETLLSSLRASIADLPHTYAGASTLPGGAGVWARLVADDAHALRTGLAAAWSALRETLTGQAPRPRRK